MAFLRSPEAIRAYGIDPARLVVAGHSMGGFAAAAFAAGDSLPHSGETRMSDAGVVAPDRRDSPPLAGLILLDAWNIAATAREVNAAGDRGRAAFIQGFDDVGHSLGPITAADLADEVTRSGEKWDLKALAPRLAATPILIVYATHGNAEENKPIAAALHAQGATGLKPVEIASDHAFADSRIALAAEIVRWLQDSSH
jgi:pimeloyl-ACP methyl ester carboxylesterase